MITGASSGISAQFPNPAQSSTTKADGSIFDSVLSGMIKGKEPSISMQEELTVSPETKDSEESANQEATEQAYLNLFTDRILQDGKSTASVRNVPTDEKTDQTGTWLVSVAENQQVITAKLDYAVSTDQTPARPEAIEAKSHMKSWPLSDADSITSPSGSQADEQASIPVSIGIREYGEKERYLTNGDVRRKQVDFSSAESEISLEQKSESSLEPVSPVQVNDLLKHIATMPWEHKMRQTDRAFPLQENSPPEESLTNFSDGSATVAANSDGQRDEQSAELQARDTTVPQPIADYEVAEQAHLNLFPYRILLDGKSTASVRNVPTDEKTNQTGTWLVSVAENQQVKTAKLDYAVPTVKTPARPEAFEARIHIEQLPLSDAASITSASGSQADEKADEQADEQASIPESIGISESGKKERYLTKVEMRRQQVDFSSAEPENLFEQGSENSLISDTDPESKRAVQSTELKITESTNRQSIPDEEGNSDQPETVAKPSDSNGNKAPLIQKTFTLDLVTENMFSHKPSKVTASHIEDIQRTIEMQIEKTPVLGNTVVKILLTPDNIGDIHVQLIKTKDSITAVLHVQDAETKGLLEDQLPLLMEPFKHSTPDSPLSLTVVADPSLAFSFSEGADQGHRKMERQESRKRSSRVKAETKQKPTTKQSSRGLSLLA